MTNTCGECAYWRMFCKAGQRADVDEDRGVCRRYPPVLDPDFVRMNESEPTDDPNVWISPVTVSDEFCGEWKARSVSEEIPCVMSYKGGWRDTPSSS